MKSGALVLSVGGTLAALVGSIGVSWAPWASRTMLVTNLVVIAGSLVTAWRARKLRCVGQAWWSRWHKASEAYTEKHKPSTFYTWKPSPDDRTRKAHTDDLKG
jgi:hypothetical protein